MKTSMFPFSSANPPFLRRLASILRSKPRTALARGRTTLAFELQGDHELERRAMLSISPLASPAAVGAPQAAIVRTVSLVSAVPTNVVATAKDQAVELTWTAPQNTGGYKIGFYVIEYQYVAAGGQIARKTVETSGAVTRQVISGLTNGTSYTFRVAAVTPPGGTGPFSSPSSAVTPPGYPIQPNRPTAVTAFAGNGSVQLRWSAPLWNGGSPITNYVVQYQQYRPGQPSEWISVNRDASPATTVSLAGLANGQFYSFRVAAVNARGASDFSDAISARIPTVVCTAGNRSVTVRWQPAFSDGGSITGYRVQYSADNGATWRATGAAVSGTTTTVANLDNGVSYVFRVAAVSALGVGEFCVPSAPAVPSMVPGAPQKITAAATGSQSASVSWLPPNDNGGSAVTSYDIQFSWDAGQTWIPASVTNTAATTSTVNGLPPGRQLVFRVAAINRSGKGVYSSASAAVTTPAELPGVPQIDGVRGGNGQCEIRLAMANSDGGSAITSYEVRYSTGDISRPAGLMIVPATTLVNGSARVVVSGLVNGLRWKFSVVAVNAVGSGPAASATADITSYQTTPVTFLMTRSVFDSRMEFSYVINDGFGNAVTNKIEFVMPGAGKTTIAVPDYASVATNVQITAWNRFGVPRVINAVKGTSYRV